MDETGPIYKVKVVPFLGRSVPIVLQNDNGPCPLLAICNVLLLRNQVKLCTDITEISSSKLLSLIAERLIDTNILNGTKSVDYERNLQQNIADAMQLLPRLRTGIDVNLRFRHIHDFEFTPECALFDLFDIGLVHGWLFDPQDKETSEVIGSDSYNTLQEKLVALQARRMAESSDLSVEEPTVDFAAATTATLGVPTPLPREMWSSEISFEDVTNELNQEESKQSPLDRQRKGDDEEAAMLLQALQLSRNEGFRDVGLISTEDNTLSKSDLDRHLNDNGNFSPLSGTSICSGGHLITPLEELDMPVEVAEIGAREENSVTREPGVSTENKSHFPVDVVGVASDQGIMKENVDEKGYIITPELSSSSIFTLGVDVDRPVNLLDVGGDNFGNQNDTSLIDPGLNVDKHSDVVNPSAKMTSPLDLNVSDGQADFPNLGRVDLNDLNAEGSSDKVEKEIVVSPTVAEQQHTHVLSFGPASHSSSRSFGSSGLEDEEPLYEGEDDFANLGSSNQGDSEPLYEGEVVLAELASGSDHDPEQLHVRHGDSDSQKVTITVSDREGRIIRHFLEDNASQLTFYGLFSLVENLKEHELCVFFRNNHFSTLFKRRGKLLLLASDQGYLHQPVVWEQLESVDGDTIFLKGDFTPFTAEEHNNGSWNMNLASNETADFMSTHTRSEQDLDSQCASDLQLALALQQQELDQQQQQHQQLQQQPPRVPAQSSSDPSAATQQAVHTRMFVGPSRGHPVMPKPESAKKEKCSIM
ncbi:uncharacterized protein [Physcomitrium patens]|uniref:MINDY deubiquitinase domain-containing protein n=1 Tax=Physcomitrium patens TaxID=3218 RepID=A0A2K1J2L0_PHYPA|nr:uncharacterized protein LOC112294641 isoform X2 [Physcomitrium patens]PNR35763.1 hypothetical protein PHYPA_021613 [Physcomitrium patens]|eukprot:XP_024401100.1 uncharacterized protein LOC112294641 isoform X2 [Physcomitrella patens]